MAVDGGFQLAALGLQAGQFAVQVCQALGHGDLLVRLIIVVQQFIVLFLQAGVFHEGKLQGSGHTVDIHLLLHIVTAAAEHCQQHKYQ